MNKYVYVMCLAGDPEPTMVSFRSCEVSAPSSDDAYDIGHFKLFPTLSGDDTVLNDYVHRLCQ